MGILIVSTKNDEIKQQITLEMGRGVTVFKSDKGFGSRGNFNQETNILFCVVTRLEVTNLPLEIEKIDPNAFVVQHPVKDTKGGMVKKRPLH